MELLWGPALVAVTSIVVAYLSRLQNRDTKKVDENIGVLQEQREGWSALLVSKDAEIVRLNTRNAYLEGRLALVSDADHAIAERDAIIASLVAKLGPIEAPTQEETKA